MKFGPLEHRSALTQVPGTVIVSDSLNFTNGTGVDLKRAGGGSADIILNPQPSEDPNDPLNWPTYKKLTIVSILMYGSCICAATIGPLLSASLVVLSTDLHRSLKDITLTTGYLLLVSACSGPFISALARKFGKRPAFLFSSLMGLLGSIIGAVSHSYHTFLAARIVQGFATAAYESLVISVIGDMFFVHQRGIYSAMVIFTLNAVSNLSPLVCGSITDALGWRYLFILLVVAIGLQLILCFLFVTETTYHRDIRYNTDETANTNLKELAKIEHEYKENATASISDSQSPDPRNTIVAIPKKKSFLQELKIYNGVLSDEGIISMLAAPFIACTNLSVLWMVVTTGGVTSFYVAASYVAAQVFMPPPYLLSVSQVGYTFLGPFVGGVLGTLCLGAVSDAVPIRLAKRNKGIYEPEFRLVPMCLGLVAGAGFIGFGYVTSTYGNVYLASFLWGLSLFGITFVVVPASTYIIDAFRDLSHEAFIAAMMFKNFIFYAYANFVNDWTASAGPDAPFYTFGGATFGLILSGLIVFVWGKRYRSFWYHHNVFEKLNIRTHSEV